MANNKRLLGLSDTLIARIDAIKYSYDKATFTETVRWLLNDAVKIKEKEMIKHKKLMDNYFASLPE